MRTIPEIPFNQVVDLTPLGASRRVCHQFDERQVQAIRASLATQRPLLIRGEPGTGKTQMARAAAKHLGRVFIQHVVNARSEGPDLLWRFDQIGRLGEAQALGALSLTDQQISERLDPMKFLSPGPLWWAFNWANAEPVYKLGPKQFPKPVPPAGWQPSVGCVVLIDEIDKADSDLPNCLLESFGDGAFSVPWQSEPVSMRQGDAAPLVIITTNEERALPAAFLRRCLVLDLSPPQDEQVMIEHYLEPRAKLHLGSDCTPAVYRKAAELLVRQRRDAKRLGQIGPGLAEYIDLLEAVVGLSRPNNAEQEQLTLLTQLAALALNKSPRLR